MSIPIRINHVETGTDRLLQQFKEKPRIHGVLSAYLNQIQDIEDGYLDLLNGRSVYTATGNELDLLGGIVVEPRLDKDDDEYRAAILNKIATNNSEGTPNQLLQILTNLTSASKVALWEHYPANTVFYANVSETSLDAPVEPLTVNGGLVVGTSFAECTSSRLDQGITGSSHSAILQSASPASVGDILTIFDPNEDTFVGAELEQIMVELVDGNGNNITDEYGRNIMVTHWQEPTTFEDRNVLAEIQYTNLAILTNIIVI